jgi:hypothetical protein
MKLSFTVSADLTIRDKLPEKELQRYLNALSVEGECDKKQEKLNIHLSIDDCPGREGSFTIRFEKSEKNEMFISVKGHDESGLLYAVYELLERIGFGFYPDRDIIPKKVCLQELYELNFKSEPAIPLRGMFVIPWFDDLPCYAIYWNYNKWEVFIDWIAKQKMNFLRLHIFPSMGFYPMEKYKHTRPEENDSIQKRFIMQKIIARAHERGISVALSFYPNAVTREFSELYPETSYNAWYTYFVCLDSKLGWDYSHTTVRELIEAYHPDYIELVTTEVHCPFCGWEKFSKDQLRLFEELVAFVTSAKIKTAIFPFVFPFGYSKLMEEIKAPKDTLLFTETANLSNTDRYLAGGHYIACFEENSAPFMRFKLREPNEYACNYSRHGTALTYYLTGFTTKNFEISAAAAAKQFWNPSSFQTEPFLERVVRDRFPELGENAQKYLVNSLRYFENAWHSLECITLGNGERMFGLMPSVANSNYSMFLETYAGLLVDKKENIEKVLFIASEALNFLQNARTFSGIATSVELDQLELNQKLFFYNYQFLIKAAQAFVWHRRAQNYYKTDLWGKHVQAEHLAEDAHALMDSAVKILRELLHVVRKDPDYHDVKTHVHPYQNKDASVYHNHSGFTMEVLQHRLCSANALLDEIRALKDKLILERTFQGPHRPFVIPNQFQT